MTREGCRLREFAPRGRIEAIPSVRCPDCHADSYFVGEDLECGKLYETARARFCAHCEQFHVLTEECNYEIYNPSRVLQVLKAKIGLLPAGTVDQASPPCPTCAGSTYTVHKDIGAIDYYDNYWTVCTNPFCDWPGTHREEVECGPYAQSTGVHSSVSDVRRFQSLFISYSNNDLEFAEKLHLRLKQSGLSCWYAPHDIRGGKTVREQLQSAVRKQERLLLILSESSMSSDWVQYEVSEARRREHSTGTRVLFPIRLVAFEALKGWVLEDDESPDLAKEIRKYYIPDFSSWREDGFFEEAFEKLIESLVHNSR